MAEKKKITSLFETVQVVRKYYKSKPKLTEHKMSAEELLIGDTLFSEDEMTMEMNLDIATDTNKKSLLELKEMNKQAA